MTAEQFERVEQLFEAACALPADRRAAFLLESCADDPAVRAKVQGMLARDGEVPDYLDSPAMGRGFHVGVADDLERRLREEIDADGKYRILDLIGEGGFGAVYCAEQLKPVRRIVALKVLKVGMDTKRLIARFEHERQTLAGMNHSGIAKLFDAGATPSGRPFFAMELVEGRPITAHCESGALEIRDRLGLFLQVCDAVQHAHQRGVIHRDLKPGNILVAEGNAEKPNPGAPGHSALPKVIDFGIARAVDEGAGGHTLITEQGQMVGTPEYMSPEQARGAGSDIDTRTDVYSLGVVLYELLTGGMPLDSRRLRGAGWGELQRIIREVEPPKPSARMTELAAPKFNRDPKGSATHERQSSPDLAVRPERDPRSLVRQLRGDLDWIVMKAIEKDRGRRYPTAAAFADDIHRYLNDEPVLARPPTASYRFGKFARRHKAALAAGIAFVVLLAGGIIGTTIGLVRARQEAEKARTESAIAQAVTDFLNKDLLSSVSPEEKGKDVGMRAVLDEASKRIEGRFPEQPRVEAAVRMTLADTYQALGLYVEAESHATRARDLRTRLSGNDDPATRDARRMLALLHADQGRYVESEQEYGALLELDLPSFGKTHEVTATDIQGLARAAFRQGNYAEARNRYEELLDLRRRTRGEEDPETLDAMSALAQVYLRIGRFEDARPLMESTLAGQRRRLGEDHPDALFTLKNLASLAMRTKDLSSAAALTDDLLERMNRVFGPDHPNTLYVMADRAQVHKEQGEYPKAVAIGTVVMEGLKKALGPDHAEVGLVTEQLADVYGLQRRWSEAESLLLTVMDINRRAFGPRHSYTMQTQRRLGNVYLEQSRFGEAELLLAGVVEDGKRTGDHRNLPGEMTELARALIGSAKYDEAQAALLEAVEQSADSQQGTPPATLEALVALYEAWGKPEPAAEWRAKLPGEKAPASQPS